MPMFQQLRTLQCQLVETEIKQCFFVLFFKRVWWGSVYHWICSIKASKANINFLKNVWELLLVVAQPLPYKEVKCIKYWYFSRHSAALETTGGWKMTILINFMGKFSGLCYSDYNNRVFLMVTWKYSYNLLETDGRSWFHGKLYSEIRRCLQFLYQLWRALFKIFVIHPF